MSLRNRVALAGGMVVLIALTVASLVLYPVLGGRLSTQRDDQLVSTAAKAPDLLANLKRKIALSPDRASISLGTIDVGGIALQFVPAPLSTAPVGDTKIGVAFPPLGKRDLAVATGLEAPYFGDTTRNGTHYRVYTAPLTGGDGALIRTAAATTDASTTLDRIKELLLALTLGGGLIAATAARLAAGRVLRPVRRLSEAVEHVTATQDLTARLDTRGRDEIARLASAFTVMMATLDESVQAQRRLVADASHELRTPLTSLTTNLELLDEGQGTHDPQAPELVKDARLKAEELKVLVNDLVDLARYGSAQAHLEDTRLDLLAARVVERAVARGARVEFRTELTECLVTADPDAVERALSNLVDNAVKWSPDGGRVLVRVDADGTVLVCDQGPGIPAADLPFVFDRFYRSPTARALPGSGLGLAIVRQIAEAHGGEVHAEPLDQGLCMRFSLPASS